MKLIYDAKLSPSLDSGGCRKSYKPDNVFRRRFNFKKAKWVEVTKHMNTEIQMLQPTPENYCKFVDSLKNISRKYIPRGCRINNIKRLRLDIIKNQGINYERYEEDPFFKLTIAVGKFHMMRIAEE